MADPMTSARLEEFAANAPEVELGELWSLLDWSFWGAGMADTFREPLANTMLAAIPADVRAQAEAIMADFIRRREIEKTGATIYQEQRDELERLRAELRGCYDDIRTTLGYMFDGTPLRAESMLAARRSRLIGLGVVDTVAGPGRGAAASSAAAKDERGHTPADCTDRECIGCRFCAGAPYVCGVCHGADDAMPSSCPEQAMTGVQVEEVRAGRLDYRDGLWVNARAPWVPGDAAVDGGAS